MAKEERFTVEPLRDVEMNIRKSDLEYFLTYPESGIGPDTGLIFSIPGFGDKAASEYQKDKLRPYLADKYNSLVCGVNYTGSRMYSGERLTLEASPQFVDRIHTYYGIAPESYVRERTCDFDSLSSLLARKGINRLNPHCRILRRNMDDEYESFGFLPAIEHLHVLGDILKRHAVNKSRIVAFGSSYGGYIALLLGKYAPHTFSAIIDNSGFVRILSTQIFPQDLLFFENVSLTIKQVIYPYIIETPWTVIDETSPRYFSDSHRKIRSLLIPEHVSPSETKYFIFHSEKDDVAPTAGKDLYVHILRSRNISVDYSRIGAKDVDGRIFKNLEHGMSASLRGLFDLVAGKGDLKKTEGPTDFDFDHVNRFDCGDRSYAFTFRNSRLNVDVENRMQSASL